MKRQTGARGAAVQAALGVLGKAASFVGFAVVNLFIGIAILAVGLITYDAIGFRIAGGEAMGVGLNIAAQIAAIPLTLRFRRYWIRRGIEENARRAIEKEKQERADAALAAMSEQERADKGDMLDGLFALISGLFWLALIVGGICFGLYAVYALFSSMTVPVAIVIGAVIIGISILVTAR